MRLQSDSLPLYRSFMAIARHQNTPCLLPSRAVPSPHHIHPGFQHLWFSFRLYASSSDEGRRNNNDDSTSTHQMYLQQIQELEAERESLFGDVSSAKTSGSANENATTGNTTMEDYSMDSHTPVLVDEAMKRDREVSFGFTSEEVIAWSQLGSPSSSSSGNSRSHSDFLREIETARQEQSTTPADPKSSSDSATFTHLSLDGTSIQMVDVGSKAVTRRTATAQAVVVFPPEVLLAFGAPEPLDINARTRDKEWMGSKGPIFATAITAGIMGVKQTSSLIPLCHPLPLENVTIDIAWSTKDSVRITCTCSATHKTGVEMEALMGCSIAALTIYDMVKAVSHNVQITNTQLLYKEGGKRFVDQRTPQ
jgi:cyclic pyranopterin monophosphate synthase